MRRFFPLAGLAAGLLLALSEPALGQSSTRPSPSPVAPTDTGRPMFDTTRPQYDGQLLGVRGRDTVVAEVDGRAITLAQVSDRIRDMPTNIANLPFEVLFPNMVDQLIRREALVLRAQRRGLDADPLIRRRVSAAADEVLANEAAAREVEETITEAQLLERYRRDYAGKPGPEEARVRIIVVPTEAEASAIIGRLRAGEDFATLAKAVSKDSSAAVGGDLGFLPRAGLNIEVGAIAFVLPPGQVAAYPVPAPSGWFVIKTEARRVPPTPSFATVREQIRRTLLREGASAVIQAALADVIVRQYNLGGKEAEAVDQPGR
jgi:peptidyl-prolyl cis-trans isomerase C